MGNTHTKRSSTGDDGGLPGGDGASGGGGAGGFAIGSPPVSPGSPLTYTPQVAMEPISRHHEHDGSAARLGTEFVGAAGWPAQPKLVPVEITWGHAGEHVQVEGSFDNWTTRQPLQRNGREFSVIKLLPPGVYQYKFIVDGEWQHDPNQRAMRDENGNINNVLEVQEYVPENLENVSGFDPPPSPVASYSNPAAMAEDYAKEPPIMPPHLQLTLLNVPSASSAADASSSLPRPQHVILNHVYIQRGQNVNALVLGTTHRYKGKYITTVFYRPRGSSGSAAAAAAAAGRRPQVTAAQQPFAQHPHQQQQPYRQ